MYVDLRSIPLRTASSLPALEELWTHGCDRFFLAPLSIMSFALQGMLEF